MIGAPPSVVGGFHSRSADVAVRLDTLRGPTGAEGLSVNKTNNSLFH